MHNTDIDQREFKTADQYDRKAFRAVPVANSIKSRCLALKPVGVDTQFWFTETLRRGLELWNDSDGFHYIRHIEAPMEYMIVEIDLAFKVASAMPKPFDSYQNYYSHLFEIAMDWLEEHPPIKAI